MNYHDPIHPGYTMMKRRCAIVALLALSLTTIRAGLQSLWAQTASPDLQKGIAASLQPYLDSHTLAGVVALTATKDKVLSLEAIGYADLAAKEPMRPDSLFWIASMFKPMTATAMMMLVDEGKVQLNDAVEKYLPEFAGQMLAVQQDQDHAILKKPAHPIIVREILSHTSGLPPRSRVERRIDALPLQAAAISYAMSPLEFEPGSKFKYCNAGINTAGRIIEVVSGMPYERFMDERLFMPLGMNDTTFHPTEQQLERLAKSYKINADGTGLEETDINQLTYPLAGRDRHPCPAGGLFSTATDIAVFCRMILANGVYEGKRYVSEAAVRQMSSTQFVSANAKNEIDYGLGWYTTSKVHDDTKTVSPGPFGHGGAYATDMWIDPQQQLVTVIMPQRAEFGPHGKIRAEFTKAAMEAFAK
ncbi:MAG: serine hydrolase [Candidatus Sumerlaeota bacterium]|nr:serine hydrolase [Candidatus Sumerlaeota bacterium]